jgi:hypothetical protein
MKRQLLWVLHFTARIGLCFAPAFARGESYTPNKLPELIEGVLKKHDMKALAARIAAKKEK